MSFSNWQLYVNNVEKGIKINVKLLKKLDQNLII